MDELKARGGCIIGVITEGVSELHEVLDHVITIPRTHDALTPILAPVPLQLLAHYIAALRGENVDQPAEPGAERDGEVGGQGERLGM